MLRSLALAAILLTGCDSMHVPLPSRCQAVGVAVDAGDIITGAIALEHIGTLDEVSVACQSPFKPKQGCVIAVGESEYELWYVDDPAVRDHERCHALYEVAH